MTDHDFMRMAIEKAREGMAKGGSPFGACIVRAGKVIACEHNVVLQARDATAHAEVTTIRAACQAVQSFDLSGCTIYSTTEPCPMCFAAIHWAQIDRIVFGASITDALAAGFRELTISNQQMKDLGGSKVQLAPPLLQEENRRLFQEFVAKGGKTY